MLITPIKDPKLFNKHFAALDCTREFLIQEAERREEGELLSFLPDVDVEKTVFLNTELCTHILYYNFRQLLRLPTLGQVDQKSKYSTIYSSGSTMRQFFGGRGLKMLTYRVVAEVMLLYGLSAEDMEIMSRWCCTFEEKESSGSPNYDKLAGIYAKKQVVKQIKAHVNTEAAQWFPIRIMKGMEYISYADFLHVFRSVGQNPYKILYAFVTKATSSLGIFGANGIEKDAFALTDLSGKNVMRRDDRSTDPPFANSEMTTDLDAEFVRIINQAVAPMSRRRPIHLIRNIKILRSGASGAETAPSFDALFVHSHCSNLDIFNYLVRTSIAYGIPMYELFYHIISPKQYPPKKEFEIVEYTLEEVSKTICDGLSFSCEVNDENLFEVLSIRPPFFLAQFGEPRKSDLSASAATTPAPQTTPTPIMKEVQEEDISMNTQLKLRICHPCSADDWENDNPDRNAPGFHWTDANAETLAAAQREVDLLLKSSVLDILKLKKKLSETIKLPFKARLQLSDDGIRASIDIF